MLTVGLSLGIAIPHVPYPRLALAAHTQYMVNGFFCILVALLLLPTCDLDFNQTQLVFIRWSWNSAWVVLLLKTCNAWWGTTETLPIVGLLFSL